MIVTTAPPATVPATPGTSTTARQTTSTTVTVSAQTTTTVPLPKRLPADAVRVHAPVLMYHYVDTTPPPAGPYADGLTVRTPDFEAELRYLADNGYTTVGFRDVYLAMAGEEQLPKKAVC